MKKFTITFVSMLILAVLFVQCSKKGIRIIEPKYGIYEFSTYTVDSFRFRVVLNGEILTDSLNSPVGLFSTPVRFYDTEGRLQIFDARNNDQLILDSVITIKTGRNTFSLVQLLKGQQPYIPALPNEPLPAPGNFKVRFQYTPFIGEAGYPTQPFFYDSISCFIQKNGVVIDTVVLQKYGATSYYEAISGGGASFSIYIENPYNGDVIDVTTSPSIGASLSGFNTVSVSGRAMVDDWRLKRIY